MTSPDNVSAARGRDFKRPSRLRTFIIKHFQSKMIWEADSKTVVSNIAYWVKIQPEDFQVWAKAELINQLMDIRAANDGGDETDKLNEASRAKEESASEPVTRNDSWGLPEYKEKWTAD